MIHWWLSGKVGNGREEVDRCRFAPWDDFPASGANYRFFFANNSSWVGDLLEGGISN